MPAFVNKLNKKQRKTKESIDGPAEPIHKGQLRSSTRRHSLDLPAHHRSSPDPSMRQFATDEGSPEVRRLAAAQGRRAQRSFEGLLRL